MARKISKEHIDAYKNGIFKKLFEVIKEDPELTFEIRMEDQVMIYYHKDKILTTKWHKRIKPEIIILDEKYYSKYNNKPSVCFDNEYELNRKEDIRSYFREAKKLVYVYKMGAEFNIQQNIALGNNSFNDKNRFLVVDMEWQLSQMSIPENERIKPTTRIDLVIVDMEKDSEGYNDIYLAELKLGLGATEGNSGTIDHVNKTWNIIKNEKACASLFEDVESIIEQKEELGLIKGEHKDFHFGKRPKMMLILAYRGEDEEKKLKAEFEKAKEEAHRLGMDEPKRIMHNALIKLE